ncbi:MAG: M48 family metallopeptidase [Desulfobacterales bacterium]
MNVYAIVILIALIAEWVLHLIADFLNLKAMKKEFPVEANNIYDEKEYRRSQNYTSVTTRFGWLVSTFNLVLLLAFWILGGFNWLDLSIREWDLGPVLSGMSYIGILFLLQNLISLPFDIFSTFVLENRFGFNRTTPGVFIGDLFKNYLLAVLIGGPLLAGLLLLLEHAGSMAWLYCWAAVSIHLLIVQLLAPTWIMPLFNKFIPLEDGELKRAIFSYARRVDFPLKNIFVMDGSKRSSKSNAFFTGFGKNKRVVLFDNLVEKNTVAELVSILAHEIGHFKKRHIWQGMVFGILHMGVIFYLFSIFLTHPGLYEAFYMKEMSIYAGLVFFILLFSPIELFLSIFHLFHFSHNRITAIYIKHH